METTTQKSRWSRAIPLLLSAFLCGFVTFCYAIRPDDCAAITVFPVWTWPLPGLLLTATGWSRHTKRFAAAVVLLWLAYLLVLAEEPWSLLRSLRRPLPHSSEPGRQRTLRVVSLNCAGGSAQAAAEVAQLAPDIVLLQEAPIRKQAQALARRLYGREAALLWGLDTCIIARGRITPAKLPPRHTMYFVQGRVQAAQGVAVEVVNLRLLPPLFRMDLWNPECWRAQKQNRQARREQLQAIANRLSTLPPDEPVLAGGDFNAPAGDAIFALLRSRLSDSFARGGRGWGNTIINDVPPLPIHPTCTTPLYRVSSVWAQKTTHSDHRIVVCDLAVTIPGKQEHNR